MERQQDAGVREFWCRRATRWMCPTWKASKAAKYPVSSHLEYAVPVSSFVARASLGWGSIDVEPREGWSGQPVRSEQVCVHIVCSNYISMSSE
jgi:hypothetical protein